MFERHKLVSTAIVKTISLLVWHGASTIQIRSSTYKKKKRRCYKPTATNVVNSKKKKVLKKRRRRVKV